MASVAARSIAPGPAQRVGLNDRNDELRTNAQNIPYMTQESRPKNTLAAYEPKQKEFKDFCLRKQYDDVDTVTEDKLLLFLVEEVADRPLRAKSRNAAKDGPQVTTRLAWRSVRSYITAITDLYHTQKALGMKNHPSPYTDNVRGYLRSLQRRDTHQDETSSADNGRNTHLDGYTEEEFERVCHELWAHSSDAPECHLRTLVDLLLGEYMLGRGCDRRATKISNLSTFEFEDEGPTRCMPLIFTTWAGTQNQHGRLEAAGALRNRKPAICMLSGLAFYLLSRWDLTEEPFPDFSRRSAWYDIQLIKGADPTTALSYNSQRDWVVKAFAYVGIASKTKTNTSRSSGAKTAELKGVSEDQICRAGRWNQEQMISCYLDSLPWRFMRMMAGHRPQKGCFEIQRAAITPPDTLLSMVWPDLDQWKGRFGLANGQINDLAAMGFTNLLFYLREVILQDSVSLMQQFPDSPVWRHPVFQHEAYIRFSQEASTLVQEGRQPSQMALLVQAFPVLADFLQSVDARNEARIASVRADLRADLRDNLRAMEERMEELQNRLLQALLSGGIRFRLTAESPGLLQLQPMRPIAGEVQSTQTAASSSADPSGPIPPAQEEPAQEEPGQDEPAREEPAQEQNAEEQPPQYCMCRTIKTVEELWREWTVGLRGQPAIAALDSRWGSRWRAGRQSELQWYSLRSEIIKEIRRIARVQRISEEAAMRTLSLRHQRMGCSIDRLCKLLRSNRKAQLVAQGRR